MTTDNGGGPPQSADTQRLSPVTLVKMLAIAVLGAVLYLSFSGVGSTHPRTGLPPFELELLSGGTLKAEQLKGRVTVLNFFATWCQPCMAEMPELDRFARGLDPQKAAIYGIAAGSEHRLDIRAFVERKRVAFPVALDGEALLSALNSQALPTTVLVDPEGNVDEVIRGTVTQRQLEQAVERLGAPHAH